MGVENNISTAYVISTYDVCHGVTRQMTVPSLKMRNSRVSTRRWRKSLRYIRWASKAAFLLLFIVPIAYVPPGEWPAGAGKWSAPMVPVISLFFPAARPFFFPANYSVTL